MAVSVLGLAGRAGDFRSRLRPFRPDSARRERAQRELGPDRAPLLPARALRSADGAQRNPRQVRAGGRDRPRITLRSIQATSRRALALVSGNRACRRMHRANASAMKSVVVRNGILFRCRVHRGTSIGGLPRASPSDRAPRGWGTTWGGGIKGWGKVTRSGLLGTPDLGTF